MNSTVRSTKVSVAHTDLYCVLRLQNLHLFDTATCGRVNQMLMGLQAALKQVAHHSSMQCHTVYQFTSVVFANSSAVFRPDIVSYNAGTDILVIDPLGHMDISPEAVIQQDEMVIFGCGRCACGLL